MPGDTQAGELARWVEAKREADERRVVPAAEAEAEKYMPGNPEPLWMKVLDRVLVALAAGLLLLTVIAQLWIRWH